MRLSSEKNETAVHDRSEEKSKNEQLVSIIQTASPDSPEYAEAMQEIINTYNQRVHFFAYRILGNYEDALEVRQMVFIQLFRKHHQIHTPRNLDLWLRTIAINLSKNLLAKKKPMHTFDMKNEGALMANSFENVADHREKDPIEALLFNERQQIARTLIRRLDPLYRKVVQEFHVHHLSLEEISTKLDIPVGTVKRRLFVARKKLVELLQDEHSGYREAEAA